MCTNSRKHHTYIDTYKLKQSLIKLSLTTCNTLYYFHFCTLPLIHMHVYVCIFGGDDLLN